VKTLIVTGATGYVGTRVVALARTRGFTVVAASRRQPPGSSTPWMAYRLQDELAPDRFPAGATVIHLAAETRAPNTETPALELAAVQRLLAVARVRALRVVHVSSQAAQPDAPTSYGQAKWQVEQEVLRNGGLVVRPGLVYGVCPAASSGHWSTASGGFRPCPRCCPRRACSRSTSMTLPKACCAAPSGMTFLRAPTT
jgi:NADH dehydrogenase